MFTFKVDNEIELRLWEQRHAPQLFALTDQNRTHLRQWLGWVDSTQTVEDTQNFIKSQLQQFANNDGLGAGIWYQGQPVGSIAFHFIDWSDRKTEIGYWLDSAYEGRGIMTRACRAIVSYAFDELKLNRVLIYAATENTKSRAIPERLGFVQEGIARQAEWLYDHFIDLVAYTMLASEWQIGS